MTWWFAHVCSLGKWACEIAFLREKLKELSAPWYAITPFLSWHSPRIPYLIPEFHILKQCCLLQTLFLMKDISKQQKFRDWERQEESFQYQQRKEGGHLDILFAITGPCLETLEEEGRADFIGTVAACHSLEFLAPMLSNRRWWNMLVSVLKPWTLAHTDSFLSRKVKDEDSASGQTDERNMLPC